VGRGIWMLQAEIGETEPGGPLTSVVYDWLVVAEKGVLKRLSPIMRPIFAANHRWAMAQGQRSLRLELARRHAGSDQTVAAAISAPPGPTFPHNLRGRSLARRS